jgi:hypothetical protein
VREARERRRNAVVLAAVGVGAFEMLAVAVDDVDVVVALAVVLMVVVTSQERVGVGVDDLSALFVVVFWRALVRVVGVVAVEDVGWRGDLQKGHVMGRK